MEKRSKTTRKKGTQNIAKDRIVLAISAVVAIIVVYFGVTLIDSIFSNRQSHSSIEPASVQVNDDSFMPETITIKEGQSVVWVNSSNEPKSISLKKQTEAGSSALGGSDNLIAKGETFSYVFSSTGTYTVTTTLEESQFSNTIIVNE